MTVTEEVKARVRLLDYVGARIELKPDGPRFEAQCPFHAERTASFKLYPEQDRWHCYGSCGQGGDVIDYVGRELYNGSWDPKDLEKFRAAIRALGGDAGTVTGLQPELTLAGFCERRKIAPETLRAFKVREGAHAGRPALLWPTPAGVDRVKYLDGESPKYRWERKGGTRHLYGTKTIRPGEPVYLVNGEPSVWACFEAGVPAFCLAGGEGAQLTTELIQQIAAASPRVVRVAYDRDPTGLNGARKAVAQLRAGGIEAVALELPEKVGDKGDVDDLHRWEGARLGEALGELPELPTGGTSPAPEPGLILIRLADVEPEDVTWLWRDRIPAGKLTLLVGDPGEGKSFVSLAIATALSRGAALPGGDVPDGPADVVLATFEDGIADTIRPRADRLGADVNRLHCIEGARDEKGRIRPMHSSDVGMLEAQLEAMPDVQLLVVDPVMALLGGRTDAYRDNEVRDALQPLVQLAACRGVAVLGVMHLRKAQADRALYRIGGSGGFGALARSVLLAGSDPDSGRRAVAHIKSNLGPLTEPLEYRIGGPGGFEWMGTAPELGADRLLAAAGDDQGDATDFLQQALADGPRRAKDVQVDACAWGYSEKQLRTAREKLGIKPHRENEEGGGRGRGAWLWALPKGHLEQGDTGEGHLEREPQVQQTHGVTDEPPAGNVQDAQDAIYREKGILNVEPGSESEEEHLEILPRPEVLRCCSVDEGDTTALPPACLDREGGCLDPAHCGRAGVCLWTR